MSVSKWDLRKAAKLLGLDYESSKPELEKLAGLRGSEDEPNEESPNSGSVLGAQDAKSESDSSEKKSLVALAVVNDGKLNKIVEVTFNMEDAVVVFETDFEPRAALELQKRLAQMKMKEYSVRRKTEKKEEV